MRKIGIILLAAGNSTRLGQPKQLLPWRNTTLLQHALQQAKAVVTEIVVVTGAHNDLLQQQGDAGEAQNTNLHEGVQVVQNANWQEGIASSIRTGLMEIVKQESALDAVIFIVCDQPFLSSQILKELMDTHAKTGKPIVASVYANTVGVPALFAKEYFAMLLQLKGDEGARRLIAQEPDQVALIDFPRGEIDIDTVADYEALTNNDISPIK